MNSTSQPYPSRQYGLPKCVQKPTAVGAGVTGKRSPEPGYARHWNHPSPFAFSPVGRFLLPLHPEKFRRVRDRQNHAVAVGRHEVVPGARRQAAVLSMLELLQSPFPPFKGFGRPFGTWRVFWTANPPLKRWAILDRPSGTSARGACGDAQASPP